MEKKMESTMMGYIGPTIRINSFIPCQSKASYTRVRETKMETTI